MLVPGELTKGRAAQMVPPEQAVKTNWPLTHWANWDSTQAFWPDVQGELAFNEANCWLSAMASLPFCNANPEEEPLEPLELVEDWEALAGAVAEEPWWWV